jgi:hypothetical protein
MREKQEVPCFTTCLVKITYRWWQLNATECGTLVDWYSHAKPLQTPPSAWAISAVSRRLALWARTRPSLQKLRTFSQWSHLLKVWDRNISIVSALATGLKPIDVQSKVNRGWRNRSVKLIAHSLLRFAVRTLSCYLCDTELSMCQSNSALWLAAVA